jgi:hypothetical protein
MNADVSVLGFHPCSSVFIRVCIALAARQALQPMTSGLSFEHMTLLMMAAGTSAPYLILLRFCLKQLTGWQRKLALAPLPLLVLVVASAFFWRTAGTTDSGVFAVVVSVASILGVFGAFLCGILLVKHHARKAES